MSRLGSIEAIQAAKGELIRALPSADDGGTAILNWDDQRVRAMAEWTSAAIMRYGLTPEADLWADQIESAGMDGIRFWFHHRAANGTVESLHVRVPLLGRHSVHTALRATAVGLVEGLSWQEIIEGLTKPDTLIDATDIDGKPFFRDFIKAAQKGKGWTQYMWPVPGMEINKPKHTFIYRVPDTDYFVGAGFYVMSPGVFY